VIIKSLAGDFEVTISKFESENGQLVMVGKMGVWDARTYITAREALGVMFKLLSPVVIFFVLRMPVLLLRGKEPSKTNSGGDNESGDKTV
jgi:hypothetical protein